MSYVQYLSGDNYQFRAQCADCDSELDILTIRTIHSVCGVDDTEVVVHVYPCECNTHKTVWIVQSWDKVIGVFGTKKHAIAAAEKAGQEIACSDSPETGRWYIPNPLDETFLVYAPTGNQEIFRITVEQTQYEE